MHHLAARPPRPALRSAVAAAAGAEEGRPPTPWLGARGGAGEGRHESGTCVRIERRCAAARCMPARGCSHAAPQASPMPAKDTAVVAAGWCGEVRGWMRADGCRRPVSVRCAASRELQAICDAARRRLADAACVLCVHTLFCLLCAVFCLAVLVHTVRSNQGPVVHMPSGAAWLIERRPRVSYFVAVYTPSAPRWRGRGGINMGNNAEK